jgi:hypothetical protein
MLIRAVAPAIAPSGPGPGGAGRRDLSGKTPAIRSKDFLPDAENADITSGQRRAVPGDWQQLIGSRASNKRIGQTPTEKHTKELS